MADLPLRPMLAPVLDATVDWTDGEESPSFWLSLEGVELHIVEPPGRAAELHFVAPRQPRAPEGRDVKRGWARGLEVPEAVERLTVRDLWPDGERGWVCPACGGSGSAGPIPHAFPAVWRCSPCAGRGHVDHPATLPDLVALASLGPEQIVTAEALAREILPDCRVVWKVGERHFDGSPATSRLWPEPGRNALIADVWARGLAVVDITRGTVTLCVPPIGGSR